ncbi:MAG: hypothetical protein FWH15_07775 [Betaproteobacteria bacterium]|nr:hypothetical protein [Betaproteobacteria bacterium]
MKINLELDISVYDDCHHIATIGADEIVIMEVSSNGGRTESQEVDALPVKYLASLIEAAINEKIYRNRRKAA